MLESRLRRTQMALAGCIVLGAAGAMLGIADVKPAAPAPAPGAAPVVDEIRTRRLVVVDDQNIARIVIGQDPRNHQRRDRSSGITIHDKHGHERGGMGTFDDGSVVMALDAPRGVGDPMPDRIGMMVAPNGAAQLILIDNQTRGVASLSSDGDGGGGLNLYKWDMEAKKMFKKTLSFDGENVTESPLGEKK